LTAPRTPPFPLDEFEEFRQTMPRWKFDQRYRGRFTRPAGAIYDCFDPDKHIVEPFDIPDHWPRYLGLDFGGVHMAGVYFAEDPDSAEKAEDRTLYVYREYMQGNRDTSDHVKAILKGEPQVPKAYGGSQSENQWRREWSAAGRAYQQQHPMKGGPLKVLTPHKDLKDVEVGIDRVYKLIKRNLIKVFRPCVGVIEDIQSYARKLDDFGEALDDIKDKAQAHYCDCLRYLGGSLRLARWSPLVYESSPYD
jgi:hypothetical protein